jgi:hypothetical protein
MMHLECCLHDASAFNVDFAEPQEEVVMYVEMYINNWNEVVSQCSRLISSCIFDESTPEEEENVTISECTGTPCSIFELK